MEYHITVNWDRDRDLEADLFRFRNRHGGVTFTLTGAPPGPGSAQWPEVRIASGSLSLFQQAIRMFAIGENVLDDATRLHEEWEFALITGQLEKASFDWFTKAGDHCATEVLPAELEEPGEHP